jgi:2-polyprenyl-3-methyl-5-hydroxy-6-metoxy-1,4-benzoquinol methylase
MDIAEQVLNHAIKHYNEGGWDIVYECLTVKDIESDIKEYNLADADQAIKHYEQIYDIVNERREEVKSFIW